MHENPRLSICGRDKYQECSIVWVMIDALGIGQISHQRANKIIDSSGLSRENECFVD